MRNTGAHGMDILSALDERWDDDAPSGARLRVAETSNPPTDAEITRVSPMIAELARLARPDSVPSKLPGSVSSILPPSASLLWSRIDGRTPLRALLAGSGLDESEALRVLASLLQARRVTFFGCR